MVQQSCKFRGSRLNTTFQKWLFLWHTNVVRWSLRAVVDQCCRWRNTWIQNISKAFFLSDSRLCLAGALSAAHRRIRIVSGCAACVFNDFPKHFGDLTLGSPITLCECTETGNVFELTCVAHVFIRFSKVISLRSTGCFCSTKDLIDLRCNSRSPFWLKLFLFKALVSQMTIM